MQFTDRMMCESMAREQIRMMRTFRAVGLMFFAKDCREKAYFWLMERKKNAH